MPYSYFFQIILSSINPFKLAFSVCGQKPADFQIRLSRQWGRISGDVGHTYASTWDLSPADAALLTHDVVTPIKRAISAPEYPSSLTANQHNTRRGSVIARRREPEGSAATDTP